MDWKDQLIYYIQLQSCIKQVEVLELLYATNKSVRTLKTGDSWPVPASDVSWKVEMLGTDRGSGGGGVLGLYLLVPR